MSLQTTRILWRNGGLRAEEDGGEEMEGKPLGPLLAGLRRDEREGGGANADDEASGGRRGLPTTSLWLPASTLGETRADPQI